MGPTALAFLRGNRGIVAEQLIERPSANGILVTGTYRPNALDAWWFRCSEKISILAYRLQESHLSGQHKPSHK
jgi:hypothetical protein